jgi:hypothetical protein
MFFLSINLKKKNLKNNNKISIKYIYIIYIKRIIIYKYLLIILK